MKIAYDGAHRNLRAAAAYVNALNEQDAFWRDVREKGGFTHTRLDPAQIEQRIRAGDAVMTVRVWRPKLFQRLTYRNTVAFTNADSPHILFYHEKFIGNDIAEMVNTFVHEYIHDVDGHSDGDPVADMGHGDNSPVGKENSAPYWIGNLAERHYRAAAGLDAVAKGLSSAGEKGVPDDGDIIAEPAVPLKSFQAEAAAAGPA